MVGKVSMLRNFEYNNKHKFLYMLIQYKKMTVFL